MPDSLADMKEDWNRRAREHARYYIATSVADSEAAFDSSGQRDVGYFFDGLEHLLHDGQLVLDIGCGIGRMDRFVAPLVQHLTGLDVSGEMVRRARERLADVPRVTFVEGDGRTLGVFADESFTLVFSHIVFQHMPRQIVDSYFREVLRVLRRGGDFVFQVPEAVPGAPSDPPDSDSFEMRFYAEPELRRTLEGLGFEWRSCRRYPVESPALDFNQLRIHVSRPGGDRPAGSAGA